MQCPQQLRRECFKVESVSTILNGFQLSLFFLLQDSVQSRNLDPCGWQFCIPQFHLHPILYHILGELTTLIWILVRMRRCINIKPFVAEPAAYVLATRLIGTSRVSDID